MVYVVSDLHGCYKTFLAILKKVKFNQKKDKLYILGDILDRGPHQLKLYKWIEKNIGNNVYMIRGNHEDMFMRDIFNLKALEIIKEKREIMPDEKKYIDCYEFDSNIYYSFSTIDRLTEKGLSFEDLLKMANFFYDLPLYYVVNINGNEYRLVHAYCRKKIEESTEFDLMWCRDFAEVPEIFCPGETVIYGHTPTYKDIDIEINEKTNSVKINIDTGCVKGNKMCILRLDDMRYWYQKKID